MKIIFVIKSLAPSAGTERATTIIANELVKRGHEIKIVCFEREDEPFFELEKSISVHYVYSEGFDKRPSLVRDIDRRSKLKRYYKKQQPDIIIFVGSGRSILNIPAAKGFRTITWEHFNANVNWHLLHPISKWMASRYCNKIITLTEGDIDNYHRKYGARNVINIPNPVTLKVEKKAELRNQLVLAIGRLVPQKRFDILLDIWSKTENRKNGWKLRIVGTGKLKEMLLQKIKDLQISDSVEIIEADKNVIQHYQDASVYAMSSAYEGLPLVLIEAMAMGLPCISFDCQTGPREIIVPNETGILIPPFDIELFAKELDALLGDKDRMNQYSENTSKYIGKFELGNILDRWEIVLNEVLQSKK